jgi:hypothetical protein
MSSEQIDELARIAAERVMKGGDVSEGELKFMIAGLILSVNKLTNALSEMNEKLWTQETLERIIQKQIEEHCKVSGSNCQDSSDAVETIWTALGRILRRVFRV